ncbi:MAG TPA: alpha-ketoglutarate-dependent dioxygenase AlkB [Polyangiaceae bacterium]|nr:alpha-ketoglutarate-dependent dioxygenase AlkB [Polyangiaceae bacterium]
MTSDFRSWRPLTAAPSFEDLIASVQLDDVTKGRRGAVLVEPDASGVPIVRTTTQYRVAAQLFRPVHARLAQAIRRTGLLPQPFNNALVEHYTSAYAKMKRHSDQAQDLADGSWIAVYSCYREPELPSRRLVIHPKATGSAFEVPLEHGSVVAFSVDTNRRFTHAITLRSPAPENEWFGITFRTSKTLLRFIDGRPILPHDVPLSLASEDERRELLQMRRRENEESDFVYPPTSYTLSESDLLPPTL